MTFTGSQFRDKYEIEPRTWYRNLHSVTEYIYFTGLFPGKLVQIVYYKMELNGKNPKNIFSVVLFIWS